MTKSQTSKWEATLSSSLLTSARAKVHEACVCLFSMVSVQGDASRAIHRNLLLLPRRESCSSLAERLGILRATFSWKQTAPLWVQFYFTAGVLLVLLQVQARISMRHGHFGFVCSPFMTLRGPMVHPVKPREETLSESDLPPCQRAKMF